MEEDTDMPPTDLPVFEVSDAPRNDIPFHVVQRQVLLPDDRLYTLAVTGYGDLVFILESVGNQATADSVEAIEPRAAEPLPESYLRFAHFTFDKGVSSKLVFVWHGLGSIDGRAWFVLPVPIHMHATVVPVLNNVGAGFAPGKFARNLALAQGALFRHSANMLHRSAQALAANTATYHVARERVVQEYDTVASQLTERLVRGQSHPATTAEDALRQLVAKQELQNIRFERQELQSKQATRLAETVADYERIGAHLAQLRA